MSDLRTAIPFIGSKNVTAAGTAEALATGELRVRSVLIVAKPTNTGRVAIGTAAVKAGAALNGGYLNAGESVSLGPADLSAWFIDASVSGEGVVWTAEGVL